MNKNPQTFFYFPSYEILIDELRDYKWYTDDLIHPSIQAQNIIFERFSNTFICDKSIRLMKQISSIQGKKIKKKERKETSTCCNAIVRS